LKAEPDQQLKYHVTMFCCGMTKKLSKYSLTKDRPFPQIHQTSWGQVGKGWLFWPVADAGAVNRTLNQPQSGSSLLRNAVTHV
jgi:hypothetical protein